MLLVKCDARQQLDEEGGMTGEPGGGGDGGKDGKGEG